MKNLDSKAIGWRIRSIRIRRNMSQTDLAQEAGLGESALRSYELGDRLPKEKQIDSIAKALKVRPECFTQHEINTPLELIYTLFHFEDMQLLEPFVDGNPPFKTNNKVLVKAFRDWSSTRSKYENGQITDEEYREWKDTYSPYILRDNGVEIPDPYTGKTLEGEEREGAVHQEVLHDEAWYKEKFGI